MFTEEIVDMALDVLYDYCENKKRCIECRFCKYERIDAERTNIVCTLQSVIAFQQQEKNNRDERTKRWI